MKRSFVIRFTKQPMDAVIRARCEESLKLFYDAAGSLRGIDPADVIREGLRDHARKMIRADRRMQKVAKEVNYGA